MSGIERAADTVANSVVFIGSVLGAIITMDKNAMEKILNGKDNENGEKQTIRQFVLF